MYDIFRGIIVSCEAIIEGSRQCSQASQSRNRNTS